VKQWLDRNVVAALVVAAWAGFFWYLWLSGEDSRFIGPRTRWVVPFGAFLLSTLALGSLLVIVRRARRGRAGAGTLTALEASGLAILVIPLVAVAVLPGANLGALAVDKKAGGTKGFVEAALASDARPPEDLDFADLEIASDSERYAERIGLREGLPIVLLGFVSKVDSEQSFRLSRFYIACCAADAVPSSVTVVDLGQGGDTPVIDEWLEASGTVRKDETRYVVQARQIKHVSEPEDPYLVWHIG
jgi:uncharacterized repeat protein (TIGR03943 family)